MVPREVLIFILAMGIRYLMGLHHLVGFEKNPKYVWFWRGLARGPGRIRQLYGPAAKISLL